MSDVLKKVRDIKASFVTYMTPEESRTYDLCIMVEAEIERLETQMNNMNDARKYVLDDMREWGSKRTVNCDQDAYDLMAFEGLLDVYENDGK